MGERDLNQRRKARAFVLVQIVLLAVLVLVPWGPTWSGPAAVRAVGVTLVVLAGIWALAGAAALGRDLRAVPLPAEGCVLRTTGVYRWSRHPIYSGLLVGAIGIVLFTGSLVRLAAAAFLWALLAAKARFEEQALRSVFDDYDAYARRTGRFLPRLTQG